MLCSFTKQELAQNDLLISWRETTAYKNDLHLFFLKNKKKKKKKEIVKVKNGLTCDTGPHQGLHAKWAHSQKRLELTGGPGAMRRMPSPPHTTGVPPTFFSTQPQRCPSTALAPLVPCVAPTRSRNWLFRQTIDLRPRQQGRRAWPASLHLPILGMSVLSAFSPQRVLRLVWSRTLPRQSHHHAMR